MCTYKAGSCHIPPYKYKKKDPKCVLKYSKLLFSCVEEFKGF